MEKRISAFFLAGLVLSVCLSGCLPPKQIIELPGEASWEPSAEPREADTRTPSPAEEILRLEKLLQQLEQAEKRLLETQKRTEEALKRVEKAAEKTEDSALRLEKAQDKIEAVGKKEAP
jgi:hypothetical protein